MDDFFEPFKLSPVDGAGFDAALSQAGDALVIVYFWGQDCYNCEQFKKAVALKADSWHALDLHGLQANVYDEPALGQRFGLHGVPTFFFFHRGKKLGRITSWPGWPAFERAVRDLKQKIGSPLVQPEACAS